MFMRSTYIFIRTYSCVVPTRLCVHDHAGYAGCCIATRTLMGAGANGPFGRELRRPWLVAGQSLQVVATGISCWRPVVARSTLAAASVAIALAAVGLVVRSSSMTRTRVKIGRTGRISNRPRRPLPPRNGSMVSNCTCANPALMSGGSAPARCPAPGNSRQSSRTSRTLDSGYVPSAGGAPRAQAFRDRPRSGPRLSRLPA